MRELPIPIVAKEVNLEVLCRGFAKIDKTIIYPSTICIGLLNEAPQEDEDMIKCEEVPIQVLGHPLSLLEISTPPLELIHKA